MAARSRYAEDELARAVAHGVRQYVVLGAGLDTFAYRNSACRAAGVRGGSSCHAGLEARAIAGGGHCDAAVLDLRAH